MRIVIVGSGNVGRLYGRRWVERGHQVAFGFVRDRARLDAFVAGLGGSATTGEVDEIVESADIVVFAPPFELLEAAAREVGEAADKIVVDTTNPFNPERTGIVDLGDGTSTHRVAAMFPQAHVVKAFHNLAVDQVEEVRNEGGAAVIFLAGDSDEAKTTVSTLVVDAGLVPFDTGPLASARLSEAPGPLFMTVYTATSVQKAVDAARSELADSATVN